MYAGQPGLGKHVVHLFSHSLTHPVTAKLISLEHYFLQSHFFTMFQAISELSMVVYAALDYGLDSDTERRLSDELIGLFELMGQTDAIQRLMY